MKLTSLPDRRPVPPPAPSRGGGMLELAPTRENTRRGEGPRGAAEGSAKRPPRRGAAGSYRPRAGAPAAAPVGWRARWAGRGEGSRTALRLPVRHLGCGPASGGAVGGSGRVREPAVKAGSGRGGRPEARGGSGAAAAERGAGAAQRATAAAAAAFDGGAGGEGARACTWPRRSVPWPPDLEGG